MSFSKCWEATLFLLIALEERVNRAGTVLGRVSDSLLVCETDRT